MPLANETREIVFADVPVILDAAGALYVPQEQCLIISDLHLEKASFLRQFGTPVPGYDTRSTLDELAALVDVYRPRQVVCLGDSFHDRKAWQRLHPSDCKTLLQLVNRLEQWHWVLGNHDPELDQSLPGQRHASLSLQGLTLLHEPEPQAEAAQIVGHFHPKIMRRLGGQRVKGKALIHDRRLLIMPAFGTYTGGLDIEHDAIASLLQAPRAYLLYKQRIWQMS